jgi:hypothetical protein
VDAAKEARWEEEKASERVQELEKRWGWQKDSL